VLAYSCHRFHLWHHSFLLLKFQRVNNQKKRSNSQHCERRIEFVRGDGDDTKRSDDAGAVTHGMLSRVDRQIMAPFSSVVVAVPMAERSIPAIWLK